ncbi:MAG: glycosyltransferase family 4 protein [Dehalococcoidales bacterium]|nr:glycosyltransferase family 4 protein [Dehalococcoidales bacterium]
MLTRADAGYVGGAEVQQVLLAGELLKYGYEVGFITYGDGRSAVEQANGIEIIKVYRREDAPSLPVAQKIRSLWKAMDKARADIYFHEAGAPGVVALFCAVKRKSFVHYIPSDANVDPQLAQKHAPFSRRLAHRLDIRLADALLCQSEYQRGLLKERFGRQAIVIKNAFPLPGKDTLPKADPPVVLWAATIKKIKQPELFLRLAREIPQAHFQMVGGPGDDPDYYEDIRRASRAIPNLDFIGFVPFHRIDDYFRRAWVFVSTSEYEGFANTFIQAWMHHVPVVSLNSNPDDVINRYHLGFHSREFPRLVRDTETLLRDPGLRREIGENARSYVEREHDISVVVKRYLEVFAGL